MRFDASSSLLSAVARAATRQMLLSSEESGQYRYFLL
jgi:hypothetical protein